MKKLILSIDFDGTITFPDKEFPECGTLRAEAKEIIVNLKSRGHKIIINTCRAGAAAEKARCYLVENAIPFDAFNENLPEVLGKFNGQDCRKISADIYFDDKAYGCVVDWKAFQNYVLEREHE